MLPWSADARETIKDLSFIDANSVEETAEIKKFLYKDRYNIVVATKGFGKSLVLLAKRKGLRIHHVIPFGQLLDAPYLDVYGLSKRALSILYDKESLSRLWSICILVAVIKNTIKPETLKQQKLSRTLKFVFEEERCRTVSGVLSNLLPEISQTEFTMLRQEFGRVLVPLAQSIEHPVAVFIDNIDECFRPDSDLWYDAQICLVEAVYEVLRINQLIRLYVSVRKEAFLKFNSEMSLQYKGISLMLGYSKDELKDIFARNVQAESEEVLLFPDSLSADPVFAFLGTHLIPHAYVDDEENVFDYLYRHTLKRPRDFMEIGMAISRTPISERRPQTDAGMRRLKTIVNEAGRSICDSYIKEVLPHLSITEENLKAACTLVQGNILTREDLKSICIKLNGDNADCVKADCSQCRKGVHVFCDLYKVGLVGIVSKEPASNLLVQQFCPVGEKLFEDTPILPDSEYYLIHPVLDDRMRAKSATYKNRIDTLNIVGDGRPWRASRVPPESTVTRPLVFVSSPMDLKAYRDIVDEVVGEFNFAINRSEFANAPKTLLASKGWAKDSHIFVAILGPRYGEEIDGKSVSEHEFEAAFLENPNKILVYVLEGNTSRWDAKQKLFIEKVQGLHHFAYARGERVSLKNLGRRFKKDLTDRIAKLLEDAKNKNEL